MGSRAMPVHRLRAGGELFADPQSHVGRRVTVVGRVVRLRKLGRECVFALVKTAHGSIQCVLSSSVPSPGLGDVAAVTGAVRRSAARSGIPGYELSASAARVVAEAEGGLEGVPRASVGGPGAGHRRHLELRRDEGFSIFRIRAETVKAARAFLDAEGYLEVASPRIVGRISDGPVRRVEVKLQGRTAFLTLASILHHGIVLAGDTYGVFEVGPVFSGENSKSSRNLAEYTAIEFSVAFCSREELVSRTEALLGAVLAHLRDVCAPELECLGVDPSCWPTAFHRLTHRDVLELLTDRGLPLDWGGTHELPSEACRALAAEFGSFLWVLDQPAEAKWFFLKTREDRGRLVCNDCQLWFPGPPYRLAEGGERETNASVVVQRITEHGMDPGHFAGYIGALRDGMPPYSGIGLGLERLLMALLSRRNIRELVLFPRDVKTIDP